MLSLERLETMNRHVLNWAFPLLTAGLLVGTISLPHGPSFGDNWLSVKILSTAGLWLVFLVLLYLRDGGACACPAIGVVLDRSVCAVAGGAVASHPFATGGAQ